MENAIDNYFDKSGQNIFVKRLIILLFIVLGLLLLNVKFAFSLPADDVIPLVNEEYYPEVHKALSSAGESILCVMFLAKLDPMHPEGDEYQLVLDLINAHKRGVKVQVIFDQNVMFWEKGSKRDRIERKSKYAYDLLSRNGVPVYYDDKKQVTHSKVLIIDEYITIIGSTNWTYSALRKNHEASVKIKSRSIARTFAKKLEKIEKYR
ncbi:MAG: phospholipase D-like domain-containing protein [Candidatus Scalindua sp.]|nr:phospholipase D-like domain-containing protein [Candidatus Scalindua sp.]